MTTHPLEDLLSPDILQPGIQVLDLADNILNLVLVGTLNGAGLANGHVELELDVAGGLSASQPALARGNVGRGEADAVVARVGGAEGEAALGSSALADDAVVVVESLVDADVDAHVGVGLVGAATVVPLLCFVVAWEGWVVGNWSSGLGRELSQQHTDNKRVLWQLLEEAFLGWTVNVKVQCLCGEEQRRKGEDGEECRVHLSRLSMGFGLVKCRIL